MRRATIIGLLWGLILILAVEFPGRSRLACAADNDRAGIEFFEKKVRPVLISRCYKCHSTKAKKLEGGLLLDSRGAMRKGGESGAAVVAGKLDASLLFQAISHGDDVSEMPPDRRVRQRRARHSGLKVVPDVCLSEGFGNSTQELL